MNFIGIDQIVHGVDDLDECVRFYEDWGLNKVKINRESAEFNTLDGSEVVIRHKEDPDLPVAIENGPTLRHVVWGLESEKDLIKLDDKISDLESYHKFEGYPGCIDPSGLSLSFRPSKRLKVEARGVPMNTWDKPDQRVDEPSKVYPKAQPIKIGHVVLFVEELEKTEKFYTDVLGFIVSDRYPGSGSFLRCTTPGVHHSLFLLNIPEKKIGLNHVAYTVRDIHEVFGGGLNIDRCGWKTIIGPGRHPVTSAYFWYVKNPAGGLAEYFTDEDYCTDKWEPRNFERSNENFAEWAIADGINGNTRRQHPVKN